MKITKNEKLNVFIFLHITLLIYSIAGVISKVASGKRFLSVEFVTLYVGIIAILLLYAILWQQVIKNINISVAFANKSIAIVWGMVWGTLFFNETISINMMIGAVLIFLGIVMVVRDDK